MSERSVSFNLRSLRSYKHNIFLHLVGCQDKCIYLCDLKSGSKSHTLKGMSFIQRKWIRINVIINLVMLNTEEKQQSRICFGDLEDTKHF